MFRASFATTIAYTYVHPAWSRPSYKLIVSPLIARRRQPDGAHVNFTGVLVTVAYNEIIIIIIIIIIYLRTQAVQAVIK